jgi:hypothetical protein
MFTAGGITWMTILQPLLTVFLNAFGRSVNDFFDRQRANQNAKDLGAAEVKIETQRETIDAQQRELDAQANAPQTVDDAISRLDEGSA